MRDLVPPSAPSEGPSHRRIIAALLSGVAAAAAWFAAMRWFGIPIDARDLAAVAGAVMFTVVVAPALRRERERRRAELPIPPDAPLYGPSFFDKTYAGTPTWFFVASAVFSGISLVVAFTTLYLDVRGTSMCEAAGGTGCRWCSWDSHSSAFSAGSPSMACSAACGGGEASSDWNNGTTEAARRDEVRTAGWG